MDHADALRRQREGPPVPNNGKGALSTPQRREYIPGGRPIRGSSRANNGKGALSTPQRREYIPGGGPIRGSRGGRRPHLVLGRELGVVLHGERELVLVAQEALPEVQRVL
eukprot:1195843-Prorocentrum_minimum.AAC.3